MKVNHLPLDGIHGLISHQIALFSSGNGCHIISEVFMSAICVVQYLQSDTHIWLHHINFPTIHIHIQVVSQFSNHHNKVGQVPCSISFATTQFELYDQKICTVQRTFPKHMCKCLQTSRLRIYFQHQLPTLPSYNMAASLIT
jgi:hypothetical protein